MRNFFRMLLHALLMVTVALVSALTAMRIAIHGREVIVPKLVGLPPEEAEQRALEHGLLVQIESRFYSSEIEHGRILSQVPGPGTRVRRGWRLRLAESLGPQQVVIPDLVGQSLRAAELNLRRRGLELGTVAAIRIANLPADQVIAQYPPANASGIASPKVSLLVNAGAKPPSYIMPDLRGSPAADAARRLERAGIKVRMVNASVPAQAAPPGEARALALPDAAAAPSSEVAPPANAAPGPAASLAGTVTGQWPAPGSRVTAGSTAELQVQ